MLMCAVNELEVGWCVGAAVLHPKRPKTQLLAPNTELTEKIINTLKRLRVGRVWISGERFQDYDKGATRALSREQTALYGALMDDFAGRAKTTISTASMQKYKQRVGELAMTALSNKAYASMASRMHADDDALFAHSASVAYLSVVCGLELEPYIMRERPRLKASKARDHASLGLAGLLHDVGKTNCDHEARDQHEVHLTEHDDVEAYRDHVQVGYEMLDHAAAPASVRVAVRMHHRRWDGGGWPDAEACGLRKGQPVEGHAIHIYSRIVSAASTLDNLLTDAQGSSRSSAQALAEFASERFDGWFDPVVRSTLLRAVQPFAVGARVVLSDGTVCAVAVPNTALPCLLSVSVLDEQDRVIDLAAADESRSIEIYEGQDVSPYFYEATPDRSAVEEASAVVRAFESKNGEAA